MKPSANFALKVIYRFFAILAISASVSLAQAQSYTITDLGSLGGYYNISVAAGINGAGTVVGDAANISTGGGHAFRYSNAVMADLGTLGGTQSHALAINIAGTVVGNSYTAGDVVYHAFSYSNGVMTDLGTLGGTFSQAYGINSAATVVGNAYTASNAAMHAFSYSNGVMTDLGTLGGHRSHANNINNVGTIVGAADNLAGDGHAFSYSNGVMFDLGTLGGDFSEAFAINSSGSIVGDSWITGGAGFHAFSYSNGMMSDLGTLGGNSSFASSINSNGTIVGGSQIAGSSDQHAFVYRNGVMTDLNSLVSLQGDTLTSATGINDLGQIVAVSINYHSYLLTVIPGPANTAPTFTTQPMDQTVTAGAAASFSAAANGNPTPSLQWQRLAAGSGSWVNVINGGSYAGTTTGTLTISGTTTTMSGDQFRCIATNSVNSTASNIATLTVLAMLAPSNAIVTITVE